MATLVGEPEPSVSLIANIATTHSSSSSSSSSSLKRKRPPNLNIPSVLREIRLHTSDPRNLDAAADTPFASAAAGVGVFSRKGKKKFMEDAHRIVSSSPSNSNRRRFFGVYDGHGGRMAADFAAKNLHSNVLEMMSNCNGIEEAVRSGYLKTDQEFLNQGLCSGTCCVTAVIQGPEIAVSNVGDCRAVLSRAGVAEALTKDHRAEDENERKRIENKGGYVEIHRGAWRVHGVLTVSRSIGDSHLKEWVLAEPETKVVKLTPDMEFLVLASDGLWELVGNQEAVDTVKRLLNTSRLSSGHCLKENNNINFNEHGSVNLSPSPKLRRVSLAKKMHKGGGVIATESASRENESPRASKSRRLSLLKRVNTSENIEEEESPTTKENNGNDGLVNACKELVNLAVTRGGLDDITVMIIDLNYFKLLSERERSNLVGLNRVKP